MRYCALEEYNIRIVYACLRVFNWYMSYKTLGIDMYIKIYVLDLQHFIL